MRVKQMWAGLAVAMAMLAGPGLNSARGGGIAGAHGSFLNPSIPFAPPFVGIPDDWTIGGFPGLSAGSFVNVTGIAHVDGIQLAYILSSGQFGDSLTDITAATYQPNKFYTLSTGIAVSGQS